MHHEMPLVLFFISTFPKITLYECSQSLNTSVEIKFVYKKRVFWRYICNHSKITKTIYCVIFITTLIVLKKTHNNLMPALKVITNWQRLIGLFRHCVFNFFHKHSSMCFTYHFKRHFYELKDVQNKLTNQNKSLIFIGSQVISFLE